MADLLARFRAASKEDCYELACLFRIASGGVADYMWSRLAPKYPGLTPLEIGAHRFAREEGNFSYKNCVVAEQDGAVIGSSLPSRQKRGRKRATNPRTPSLSPVKSWRSRAASTSALWRCFPGFAAGEWAQRCSP
jgi:hypothetical protein